jgi:3-methylcrotonyl-CoA carboxylase beta subunit
MTILDTQLNARSADFLANAAAMRTLVDDLRVQLDKVAQGGGEAARAKHTARGKLLPRERVQMLLDPGTPFLELAPLAALNMYNNDAPCAGLIAGIGRVSGVDCMIVCNDATVKGGTYSASTWWTRAVPICPIKTKSFLTATTSAVSSSTRPI